jgi:PQQ-like domain
MRRALTGVGLGALIAATLTVAPLQVGARSQAGNAAPQVSLPYPGMCPASPVITRVVTLPSGQAIHCPGEVSRQTANSSQLPQPCPVPVVNDWCPVWTSAPYDGPGHKTDSPGTATSDRVMATSPDGRLVFVAGTSDQNPSSSTTNYQEVTIAYDAATGSVVWTAPFTQAPTGLQSYAQALSVGGSRLFVSILESSQSTVISTSVAYDAATGQQLWSTEFGSGSGEISSNAASADGSRFYAAGSTVVAADGGGYHVDATTIAYDGASGSQLWSTAVQGPTGSPPPGFAGGFGVAAVGGNVYMAAAKLNSQAYIQELDLRIADAASGQTLATGSRSVKADDQAGFAVSADGSHAFMEFQDLIYDSSGSLTSAIMAVAGFDAETGQSLWVSDYLGPNPNGALPSSSIPWVFGPIAASPDGSRVFAATESSDGDFGLAGSGFTTVAYDASSGTQLWASAYNTNTPFIYIFIGPVVNVDPAGRAVYVTGPAFEAETFATIAYDPSSGATTATAVWTNGTAEANAQAVSPDGSRVFVGSATNTSTGTTANYDIVSAAYNSLVGAVPAPAQVPESPWGPALLAGALAITTFGPRRFRRRWSQAARLL